MKEECRIEIMRTRNKAVVKEFITLWCDDDLFVSIKDLIKKYKRTKCLKEKSYLDSK